MLVLFIVFGWIWRKSRKAHFVVSILTAFSWFFIGIWYGFGFCPLTEWHYQVRMKLGHYFAEFEGLEKKLKCRRGDSNSIDFITCLNSINYKLSL